MFTQVRAATAFFVLAFTAAAQPAVQNWDHVKALAGGTYVRISVGSHATRGHIQGVTDDSLALDPGKGPRTFTRQEVTRVAVPKEGHRGRNALIGLGVGVAGGVVAGVASHKDCTGFCLFRTSRGQDAAIGAIVAGAIGAVVGALLPTGGWRAVYKR